MPSSKSRRVPRFSFTWRKVIFAVVLALLVAIYYKFKLYEKFFADTPTPGTPTTTAATPEPVKDETSPIQGVTDVKLFDKDVMNEETKKYVQKEVAAIVPMIMERY